MCYRVVPTCCSKGGDARTIGSAEYPVCVLLAMRLTRSAGDGHRDLIRGRHVIERRYSLEDWAAQGDCRPAPSADVGTAAAYSFSARRSIFGIPGVVSLLAQLMMTSGVMRNRGAPSTSSIAADPMIFTPRGDHGSMDARSSTTSVARGLDVMLR